MSKSKKTGHKLLAWFLALTMVAAYVPMIGDSVYAADNSQTYLELYSDADATTEMTEYEYESGVYTPIYIKANCSEDGQSWPWIGIYEGAYNCDTWQDAFDENGIKSLIWAYTNQGETADQSQTAEQYFNGDKALDIMYNYAAYEMTGPLEPGTYTVVMFKHYKTYGPVAYKQFEVVDPEAGEEPPAEPETPIEETFIELYKDAEAQNITSEYNVGDTVYVRANCADSTKKASTWFGLYKGEWDASTISGAGNSIFYDYAKNGYDGETAKDMLASTSGVAQEWDKNLTAGKYTLVLFTTDSKPYEVGACKQFTVLGETTEPDEPVVDPYEGYEIILEAEDTLTEPIDFGNGNMVSATYTQDFPKGLNLKVKAPDGVDYIWIGMYYHNYSESGTSGAWAEVTSYARANVEDAETIDVMELFELNDDNLGKVNDPVQTYYSGWRKLVLFADSTKTKIADTKYIFVRPNEKGAAVNLETSEFVYNGEEQVPTVKNVMYCEDEVHGHNGTIAAAHYDVDAEVGKDAGTYNVTVSFKNRLGGTATTTYSILPKALTDDMVAAIADGEYDGAAVTPEVVVTDGETVLVKDTDYTVAYADNNKAGEATVTIEGKGNYTGTVTKTFNLSCKHKWDEGTVTTAPTCMTEGVKTFTCQYGCGITETEPVAIDADAHKWDEGTVTTEATCIAEGVKTFTCLHGCGATDTAAVAIDTEAHAWDEGTVTTAPTCTAEGVKTFVCKHDAKHTTTEPVAIDAEAHAWDEGTVTKEATCTEEGVKTFVCKHDAKHTETKAIPVDKTNHKYEAVVTAPTCTEKGYTTYTCVCGDAYRADEKSPAGHKLTKTEAKDATCTEAGNIEYYTCEVCKLYFSDAEGKNELAADQLAVAAKGHSFGEYEVIDKATFKTVGKKEAKCSVCQTPDTVEIAKAVIPTIKSYAFNNKTKTPTVTVKNTDGDKVSSTRTFAKKTRKAVGKYKVTVKLTGAEYSGTATVYFKINPAKKSISKLTAGKKAFTVKWTKPSKTYRQQMTGYKIKYSTSSKMSNSKTVTVKSTTATTKTIKKLKAKKTYYVQIRTYKKIGSSYYYSDWSTIKKIKTK